MATETKIAPRTCPRCLAGNAMVLSYYDERWCLLCGYVVFPPTPAERPQERRSGAAARSRLAEANYAKKHCPQGHQYTEVNTYVDPRGSRRCKTCRPTTWGRRRRM